MGSPLYMQSVVDRNVVMPLIPVRVFLERERERSPNPEIRLTGAVASRTSNLKLIYVLQKLFFFLQFETGTVRSGKPKVLFVILRGLSHSRIVENRYFLVCTGKRFNAYTVTRRG